MKNLLSIGILLIGATLSSLVGFGSQDQDKSKPADSAQEKTETSESQDARFEDKFEALDNMHHFMEYISQPSYRALRKELAAEPEDRKAWKRVKSHAMILTETAGIVSLRVPAGANKAEEKQWKEISFAVYESGKEFYGSIGDYAKSKKHYEAMITSCNKCHEVFDNGKHQLGFYEKKK